MRGPAPLGGEAVVQRVTGEFDESIGKPAGPEPLVAGPRPCAQRLEGDPKRGPADGVEAARKGQAVVFTLGELEIPRVDSADVLGEHRRGIAGVPSMRAIEAEAAHPSGRERVRAGDARQSSPGALERSPGHSEQGSRTSPVGLHNPQSLTRGLAILGRAQRRCLGTYRCRGSLALLTAMDL